MRYFELYPKEPPRRPFILRVWDNAWVIAIILWLFFFWILPEIGHQVLLRDDYYGMKNYPEANPKNITCDRPAGKRIDGKFLGFYPYSAVINTGCLFNHKIMKDDRIYVIIEAQKPHTFIETKGVDLMDLPFGSYDVIYYKTYLLNQ